MALCVSIQTAFVGLEQLDRPVLAQSATETIDNCTAYVLQTAQEYQSLPTLTDIFTMPVAGDLAQMWMIGFSLPMITYLTAWGYGVVINWFNEKH